MQFPKDVLIWIRAIGSRIAVGVAIWVPVRLHLNDRNERQRAEVAAHFVAITHLVHICAIALLNVRLVRMATSPSRQQTLDLLVTTNLTLIKNSMDVFTVREAAKGLTGEKRAHYIMVITTIATYISMASYPPPNNTRKSRLEVAEGNLTPLSKRLRIFDPELADIFDRDATVDEDGLPAGF